MVGESFKEAIAFWHTDSKEGSSSEHSCTGKRGGDSSQQQSAAAASSPSSSSSSSSAAAAAAVVVVEIGTMLGATNCWQYWCSARARHDQTQTWQGLHDSWTCAMRTASSSIANRLRMLTWSPNKQNSRTDIFQRFTTFANFPRLHKPPKQLPRSVLNSIPPAQPYAIHSSPHQKGGP